MRQRFNQLSRAIGLDGEIILKEIVDEVWAELNLF
jgi:hypothetical protein